MNILVQKYGGSSLKNKECLETVCDNIAKTKENIDNLLKVTQQMSLYLKQKNILI